MPAVAIPTTETRSDSGGQVLVWLFIVLFIMAWPVVLLVLASMLWEDKTPGPRPPNMGMRNRDFLWCFIPGATASVCLVAMFAVWEKLPTWAAWTLSVPYFFGAVVVAGIFALFIYAFWGSSEVD